MFGYVKAYKPELRICEFEVYKAVYCGLCKEMGRRFGLWARFTLSYDFTFLALLSMAAAADEPSIKPGHCTFNPLKKANHCINNQSIGFAADMAILMLWHKLEDDLRDAGLHKRLTARLIRTLAGKGYRAAADRWPKAAQTMREAMAEQAALERQGCTEPDRVCHPSAHLLGTVLEEISRDTGQRRVLYRLGYLLGRYVYLCDALDDLEPDAKSGDYNPLLLAQPSAGEYIRQRARGSLYLTIAECGTAYELLEIRRFGGILENILFLGLHKTVEQIILPRAQRPKEQKF